MFFSGFRARFKQYDSVYDPGIQVPTLHILGNKENIVDLERSQSLIKVCHNPQILVHLAGHEIPDKEDDQQVIVDFLQNLGKLEKATD
jgi:poly(3-hydroxyalkanoate) synthetase